MYNIFYCNILTDIDECTDATICGAGGTCTNTGGSYTCVCDSGYVGGGDAAPCTGTYIFTFIIVINKGDNI